MTQKTGVTEKAGSKKKTSATGQKVRVRQVRSIIGRPETFRIAVRALGLGRIGNTKEFVLTPAVQGMINRVQHIVEVESVG